MWTGMIALVRSVISVLEQIEVEVPGLGLGVHGHRHAPL